MTKIVKLVAENIKRLKAVEVTPEGEMVVIGGKNGQGKSSLLDSIWYTLGGSRSLPSEPLRHGEKSGFSCLELDNGLTITRRVLDSGNTSLKVETKDGVLKSPQAVLDSMVGSISFDPLEFSRMEPRRQLEALRQLVGVDTSALDTRRAAIYEQRTKVNAEVKELRAQIGTRKLDTSAPSGEVSATKLLETMEGIEANQNRFEARVTAMEGHYKNAQEHERSAAGIASQITELENQIIDLQAQQKARHEEQDTEIDLARAIEKELGDIEEHRQGFREEMDQFRLQIGQVDALNRAVRENAELAEKLNRLERGEAKSSELTANLQHLDEERSSLIAEAEMPVTGLSFGETGVRFNDVPFEQCSSAEQTRVSVGMALAMNPELKVVLIRDGSLLDEDTFKLVASMAAEHDAQVWMEVVTTDAEKCAVIIEDGSVASVRMKDGE